MKDSELTIGKRLWLVFAVMAVFSLLVFNVFIFPPALVVGAERVETGPPADVVSKAEEGKTGIQMPKLLEYAIVVTTVVMVLGGLVLVGYGMRDQKGLGPNTLKALGTILFIPTLLLLASTGNLNNPTLAALLGTIAGYILSREEKSS